MGGAGAALGNTIGDLLEHRDGARDLRLEVEGLNTAFKDRGAQAAVRGFVETVTSGLAAAVGLAADLVAGIGDIYAALAPGVDTRAQRVRDFAAGGDALRIRDFRREPRLLAEADRQLAALRQRNAEDEAAIAHRDSLLREREQDIAAANRAAAEGMALGIEEVLSGDQAQTLADQEREELSRRQADLATRREAARRLEEAIRLVRFPRFAPDRADRPPPNLRVRPQVEDTAEAAAQVAAQVEAIRAQHEDRLARLTLTRIALVDRAERAALADLDQRAAADGADAGQIEAARTAIVAAAEEERRQLRVEGAREAARIGEEALADEAQAQEDAAQRLADATAQIEARELDLGLVSQYEAAIREAGRWRTETLADLDAVGGGSEALRARVEAVYASMVAEARAASQAQRAANEGWIDGVLSGLEQIRENSDSAFDAARDATVDSFRSMEDALASFVTTGKFSFSDFVDSVIADLARLAARQAITIPLANALFGALPGLFGGAADAGGADAFRRLQAGVGHAGGTVGAAGGVSRSVPAAIFAGAARYHAGGVAGLRPDEVPKRA